jgi:hypothetical protein
MGTGPRIQSSSSWEPTDFIGGARRDRTADLLHAMQALSQLSYGPTQGRRTLRSRSGLVKQMAGGRRTTEFAHFGTETCRPLGPLSSHRHRVWPGSRKAKRQGPRGSTASCATTRRRGLQGFGGGAAVSDSYEAAHRGMITVSIMLATVIQAIDGTIANVALPYMQATCRPRRTRSPGSSPRTSSRPPLID